MAAARVWNVEDLTRSYAWIAPPVSGIVAYATPPIANMAIAAIAAASFACFLMFSPS